MEQTRSRRSFISSRTIFVWILRRPSEFATAVNENTKRRKFKWTLKRWMKEGHWSVRKNIISLNSKLPPQVPKAVKQLSSLSADVNEISGDQPFPPSHPSVQVSNSHVTPQQGPACHLPILQKAPNLISQESNFNRGWREVPSQSGWRHFYCWTRPRQYTSKA